MIFEGALLDVQIMKNRKENEVAYSVHRNIEHISSHFYVFIWQ